MDLAEQIAAVWARRLVVLTVSVLVAASVFAWRSTAPDVYEASATLLVQPPESVTSDAATQVEFYADTVVGLAASRGVVSDALDRANIDADPEEVSKGVTAESESEPGFVQLTASGSSSEAAADLVTALVSAVTARVAADQSTESGPLAAALSDVDRALGRLGGNEATARRTLSQVRDSLDGALQTSDSQEWRVTTLAVAQASTAPVSPVPLRDALLAFLVALILVSEGLIARRAWRGALSARDPAGDAGSLLGLPAVAVGPQDGPGALAPLHNLISDAEQITVVEISRRPSAHAATLLAELLDGRGQEVLLDVAPEYDSVRRELGITPTAAPAVASDHPENSDELELLPTLAGGRVLVRDRARGVASEAPRLAEAVTAGGGVVITALATEPLGELSLASLPPATQGVCVLAVDDRTTKRELRKHAAVLQGVGLDLVALTVHVGTSSWSRRLRARRRRGVSTAAAPQIGSEE